MTVGEGEPDRREEHQVLLDDMSDLVVLVDSSGEVEYVNAAVTRLLGYEADSFVGSSLVSHVHDTDQEAVASLLRTGALDADVETTASVTTGDSLDGETDEDDTDGESESGEDTDGESEPRYDIDGDDGCLRVEARVQTRGGEWLWLEFARRSHQSTTFDGVVVTARDVTEQRQVTERFKHLVETASDLLVVLDGNGVLKYATPAAGRILGYEHGELVDQNILEYIHPDERATVVTELHRGVDEPGYTATVEHRFLSKDGEWRWLESRGRSLPDAPAIEGRIVVVTRDITDRRRRESQIAEQNERLETFAAMVSHDLQNPLTIASGNLELYRQTGDEERLDRIDEALERMSELTSDLLDLARQGGVVDDPTPVSLSDCATTALETSPLSADQVTISDALPTVLGNAAQVRSLFENLFRNVADHAGPESQVWVEPLPDGDGFFVEDDGPGIPDADAESVFDPGYSSNDNGTGLGLHILKTIATAHGWEVSVTSGRTGGARFEISGVGGPPDES